MIFVSALERQVSGDDTHDEVVDHSVTSIHLKREHVTLLHI